MQKKKTIYKNHHGEVGGFRAMLADSAAVPSTQHLFVEITVVFTCKLYRKCDSSAALQFQESHLPREVSKKVWFLQKPTEGQRRQQQSCFDDIVGDKHHESDLSSSLNHRSHSLASSSWTETSFSVLYAILSELITVRGAMSLALKS